MEEVLQYIKAQENIFAKLPIFQFLQNSDLDPYQRLQLLQCLADFAMSFKDINKDIFKYTSSDYTLQKTLNSYLIKKQSYWQEYLKYLETLEIDQVMRFSDFLKFMWSEKTLKIRRLSNNLVTMCRYEPDLLLRIIIIQAIEATGSQALIAMAKISEDLRSITDRSFDFSPYQIKLPTGHIQSKLKYDEAENLLFSLELNPEQKAKALIMIDYVFDSFTECMNGLMQVSEQQHYQEFGTRPKHAIH